MNKKESWRCSAWDWAWVTYHLNRHLLPALLDLRPIDLGEATLAELLVNIIVFNTFI